MEANCLDLKYGRARLRQRIQAAVHSVGVTYQGGFLEEEGLDRILNPRWHGWKGESVHHLSLQTLTRMADRPPGPVWDVYRGQGNRQPGFDLLSPGGLLVVSCTLQSVLLWRIHCVASQAGGNSRSLTEALL